ncbi:hypothetical protein H0H81_008303, partial [Sphagnurus paluster]
MGEVALRSWGVKLSGNASNSGIQQNSASSKKKPVVTIYTAERVIGVGFSRGALILYALLAGGDYDKGVHGFGLKNALGLVRCGFGDALIQAYDSNGPLQSFLVQWRKDMNAELDTNSRGFLPPSKHRRV